MILQYALCIDSEGVVTFPDIPFCITQGDSTEECLINAKDALSEAIAMCIDDDLDIPEPKAKGDYCTSPDIDISLKAALYTSFKQSEMTKSELARSLNCDPKEVRRLLDPHYSSTLKKIKQAFQVLHSEVALQYC